MIRGSYTVELALLSPFILGIFLFILYLTFYFYNMGIMKIMAYSTALEAEKYEEYQKEKQAEMIKNLGQEKVEGKLLGIQKVDAYVEINNSSYIVSFEGKLEMPFLEGTFLPDSSGWTILVKAECKNSNVKEWIQNIRRIKNLGDKWIGEAE